ARAELLGRFDYLSTVSGGGYVGGWLSAWMHRDGRDRVLQALKSEARGPLMPEPAPVQHLRSYSNYLAPQKGLFSADTWTLAATIVRNLLLNWLVVLPVVAAVLMVPLFCLAVVGHAPPKEALPVWLSILAAVGYVSASTGVWFVHSRRPGGFRREETKPASADNGSEPYDETRESNERTRATSPEPGERTDQKAFLLWCLLPIIIATALLSTATAWASPKDGLGDVRLWPWTSGPIPEPWLALVPAAFGAAVHLTGWAFARLRRSRRKVTEGLTILVTGAMAGGLISLMIAAMSAAAATMKSWGPALREGSVLDVLGRSKLVYTVMAFPTFFAAIVVAGFAFVGLASRRQDDEEREWSSRYSGWLMLTGIAWLAFSAVVIASTTAFSEAYAWLTGSGGIAAGLAAARLGKSPHTGSSKIIDAAKKPLTTLAKQYALAIAAPLAVVLILLCLAAVDQVLVGLFVREHPVFTLPGSGAWWQPAIVVAALAIALFGIGSVASHFVESNRFSLQAMYRARLIRAYLGASRPAGTRRPNAFTGFDPTDNLQMFQLGHTLTDAATPAVTAGGPGSPPPPDADVRPLRPFHVVNAALNVTAGSNLAWQDRKARSFTITPLDAGANGLGYRRLGSRGLGAGVFTQDAYYGGKFGMSLGTGVAISGAAASPNMGYHSSGPVSFLMTLFNARLGAWMGNPGWAGKDTFHHASPRGMIAPIFLDLLGLATDGAPVVYLSDGGHFENLGIYEMVLRRCAVIVVADASCDEAFSFDDLGNAVRKVRVDLGISIDFGDGFRLEKPVETADGDGLHYAVASIRYSTVDGPGVPDGVLIYVKPTLTGDEDRDVLAYRRSSEAFPHESTANQFFSEPQFESYRALGQHSGGAVVAGLTGGSVHAPAEVVHA
ncbi:MAG TPA: hypothetical protein VFH27_15060, partial [Longimicrobiaceae bacterium]|nr:hypothetical protein [Longimicrobiaceae bacterium]